MLRALWHLLLRGERDELPVGEQAWFREVMREPDPERQLRLNARNSRVVKERAGALRPELDVDRATDILWTLNHPDVWQLLVGERGWTPERCEDWLAGALCSQLLRGPS